MTAAERGFGFVELVIAAGLSLVITGALLMAIRPVGRMSESLSEIVEAQQRVRVGASALRRDLLDAGSTATGSSAGALPGRFPAIWPRGHGVPRGNAVDLRPDAITVLLTPAEGFETTLAGPLESTPVWVRVHTDPGCPAEAPPSACGFGVDDTIVVSDAAGSLDVLTVTGVSGDSIAVASAVPLSRPYSAGAQVAAMLVRSFSWDPVAQQLLRQDAMRAQAVPVMDNVVGVVFSYFGDPEPPSLVPTATAAPVTSYGPAPPPLGVQSDPMWPAGENCVFAVVDVGGGSLAQVPRMSRLSGSSDGTVELFDPARSGTLLSDGPWCPGAAAPNRWDADLLRIRRVAVTLRVQHKRLGFVGGAAADPIEVTIGITPRNLGLRR